jgi:hypothetical protein
MAVAIAIFGITFAAFCVWLTVRIVNRRERWAKRTAWGLLIAMAPSYIICPGPLLWLHGHGLLPAWMFAMAQRLYWPLDWLYLNGPQPIRTALDWYRQIWI